MNTINPQQAVEEYMGEQFIEWLGQFVPAKMQEWPIVLKIRDSRSKPEKLRKFALQIFLAQEAFLGSREGDPGFLRFAIANLSESNDPLAETALEILEKRRMAELAGHRVEKGIIKTHKRDSWIRLLKKIGLTDEEIERAEPKEPTRNYIADLSEVFSTSEWQTAVGAFASMDIAQAEQNRIFDQFIKNNFPSIDKDLEFLAEAPATSSHLLDKIVFDLGTKELVWQGISRQLEIQEEFLNGLSKYLEE